MSTNTAAVRRRVHDVEGMGAAGAGLHAGGKVLGEAERMHGVSPVLVTTHPRASFEPDVFATATP